MSSRQPPSEWLSYADKCRLLLPVRQAFPALPPRHPSIQRFVCVCHSTHAVRNDHNRLVADQPGKGFLNQCLVIYIQRSGCLIHEDDGSILKKALAMEIRCLSPPDSSEPFSPIMVCQPFGSFSANSSQCASLPQPALLHP